MMEKFHYICTDCKQEYSADKIRYLCPSCKMENVADQPPKGVLKTVYPYEKIIKSVSAKERFRSLAHDGFLSILPLRDLKSWPGLKVGNTPMYRFEGWPGGQEDELKGKLDFELYLKDDSQNPTFSFKDRASALVSAWAKEQGIHTIIAASTGNAGSSLAGICASQGQQSVIFVPAAAPPAKLTQIMMYGARILPVKGNYDQAFELSVKATELFGFYNRNTAYNPLTIEGKKTVSFELFAQMSQQLPDRIFVPTGDGVILTGVYKGFEDLLRLGIIGNMPVIVAVQAEGSDNLIRNIGSKTFTAVPSQTLADSISVDVPKNFNMSVNYLKEYAGEWISVNDAEILSAGKKLAVSTGIFSEPAAAAAFAGMLKYHKEERIPARSKNVVLLTGSGLKDFKAFQTSFHMPPPIDPDIHALEKVFQGMMKKNK